MVRIIAISFVLLALGCASSNDFIQCKRQLQSYGYTEIKSTGYEMFCCKEGDLTAGFTARDASGRLVRGCMCSGKIEIFDKTRR